MQNEFRVARIGGIDVYVNWSWLLAFFFITWSLSSYYAHTFKSWGGGTALLVGAISALLLFVTVLIHELAHSFTARANNLPVHTITLFIFGGVSNLTQEPQTPRVELLVAIAGPLASLVLAGLFYLLHAASSGGPSEISAVLGYLASVNLILAIFNLIPGFPLDGGRVLRALVWMGTGNLSRATRIASTIGNGIGYLFILGGLLEAFVLGSTLSGIWLAFVGWFLHNAATSSYQGAVVNSVLAGVTVRSLMDDLPPSIEPDTPIEALVYRHLLTANQRAVLIRAEDGPIQGLVTMSDVRHVDSREWPLTPVQRIMTPAARLQTVGPEDSLGQALQIMAQQDYNQLPVVEGEQLIGMLNRSHVLQYLHVRERLQSA